MISSKYTQNTNFFHRKGDGSLICGKSGDGVLVDDFVLSIWQACREKTFKEIYVDLNQRGGVSRYLIKTTLNLLETAGLITISGKAVQSSELKAGPELRTPNSELGGPLVSIIILNYNGKDHLKDCLSSVIRQTYRNCEVILVDNASSDGSVEYVRKEFPQVKILTLSKNYGFSAGNNQGIRMAKGDYIFLLNNDTALDERCVEELIKLARSKAFAAIAPKMRLFYLSTFINSIGNTVGPHAWGSDNYIGYLDLGQFDHLEEVFSACFGAVLLDKKVLTHIGLLDEGYRFYYEDADWCYCARLRGYKILAAPRAVVYHKFNATMNRASAMFKLGLVIRNRLRFALKNLELRNALWFIKNYLMEDIRSILSALRGRDLKLMLVYAKAWIRFILSLPVVLRARLRIQAGRRVRDAEIFRFYEGVLPPQLCGNSPVLTKENIRSYYIHLGEVK